MRRKPANSAADLLIDDERRQDDLCKGELPAAVLSSKYKANPYRQPVSLPREKGISLKASCLGLVSGHGFSRAAKPCSTTRASAPAWPQSQANLQTSGVQGR